MRLKDSIDIETSSHFLGVDVDAAGHGLLYQGPYRLVVRTSRCGRDNPGSTPGEDIARTLCVAVIDLKTSSKPKPR